MTENCPHCGEPYKKLSMHIWRCICNPNRRKPKEVVPKNYVDNIVANAIPAKSNMDEREMAVWTIGQLVVYMTLAPEERKNDYSHVILDMAQEHIKKYNLAVNFA